MFIINNNINQKGVINMNNFKKIGLTALAGVLVSVSANAAELSVTGGASIGFTNQEEKDQGNGWSMNDGITFSASQELDNGMNVTMKMVIDSGDGGGSNAQVMDTRIITVDMGDNGTFTFAGDGGSSVLGMIDDTTPTAYEESWDIVDGADIRVSGIGLNNMMHYSRDNTLLEGLTLSASYVPSDNQTSIESSSDYGFKYSSAMDAGTLTVGGATGETNAAANSIEKTIMYANFASETGFTVGITASEHDSEASNADKDFQAIGLSYALTPETSVSINTSTIEFENSTLSDQEAMGFSVSHVMGSMTIKGTHNAVDNVAGTAANDRSGYDLSLAFAF
jgi:outer membrane protein OmpU